MKGFKRFDFLSLVKKGSTQVFCDIEYNLLNKNLDIKNEDLYLIYNICDGIITSLEINIYYLDVRDYGRVPIVFQKWIDKYDLYHSNDPIEQIEVKEIETSGKKEIYDTHRTVSYTHLTLPTKRIV